jgi:Spy/CpxP family protein refolding chaperone
MKTTRNTKSIVFAAIILLAGTTFAFAHGGWYDNNCGCGRHMGGAMMGSGRGGNMMGPDYGDNMMGQRWGRGQHRAYTNLSAEDRAKIDAARDKFFDETRTLRRDIDDQAYALHKEMDKDNPDNTKVVQLQKQLSNLQGEFDLKAVQHRLKMRKLCPRNIQTQNQ